MVQKGSCRDPFTGAIVACRRKRKGEKRRTITCTIFPWSVISCWFNVGKSKGGKNLDWLSRDDTENNLVLGCLDKKPSNSTMEVSGEHIKKEASFSLGVVFGLIYLVATNKNEMNILSELCTQMESLLQNFKSEFRNHHQGKETNMINTSYPSTPKAQEICSYAIEHVAIQDCDPSYSWEQENSESDTTSSYQNSNSKVKRKGKNLEMDQLEAELEIELEHLQLQLDNEVVLNDPNQKHAERVVEDCAAHEEVIMSTSFKEVIEGLEMMGNMEQQGVHPRELERKLHELQEMRLQERIKELELALECAKNNLDENKRAFLVERHSKDCFSAQSPLKQM